MFKIGAKNSTNKAFLHSFKLLNPYNDILSKIAHIYKNDWELAWEEDKSLKGKNKINVGYQWQLLKDQKISVLALDDLDYPDALKSIPNPPLLLYYKGLLKHKGLSMAFVGSRKASGYGIEATDKIIKGLADTDLCLVSGLAYGIDQCVHESALKYNLRTWAVLGTGIDPKSIYPQNNIGLADKILNANGALISEFPPGTISLPQNFPLRNRIISGLSAATVVVEAAINSGALITADWAFRQKRPVYAVPGQIFHWSSEGTNRLIQKGAKILCSAEDILKDYPSLAKRDIRLDLKIDAISDTAAQIIYSLLNKNSLSFDQIKSKTKLADSQINSAITELLLKDLVKQKANQLFSKT